MSDKKKKIPDNLEGMVTDDLKKLVFEGLLGNLNNPYEGLGELDPPEVKAEREKNKPHLYIILKHNYYHAGAWLMYAADEESIYRYIFYKFFENFIACSDFFENIRIKQTPAEIARESDPSTFNFFDIKEMIDKSNYIYGHDNIFAFRITELTMTTLTTVRRLREKLPDPSDLIPPRDYTDDYLGCLEPSTKHKTSISAPKNDDSTNVSTVNKKTESEKAVPSDVKKTVQNKTKKAKPSDTKKAEPSDMKKNVPSETKNTAQSKTKKNVSSDTKKATTSDTKKATTSDTKKATTSDTNKATTSDTKKAKPSETKKATSSKTKKATQ
jgi:hypothetical protein